MSSRPLSVLIPTSWSQQKKRPASIQSNSSSNAVQSPSWSTMSFDQLSVYARRTSHSSLSLLASGGHSNNTSITANSSIEQQDKKTRRQKEKLQQAMEGFSQILLLSLNDCSLGFYRISDHIHRKVPCIVEMKKKLRQSTEKVQIAISDMEDVGKNVRDLEYIESFYNISQMIEKSLEIMKSSNNNNNGRDNKEKKKIFTLL